MKLVLCMIVGSFSFSARAILHNCAYQKLLSLSGPTNSHQDTKSQIAHSIIGDPDKAAEPKRCVAIFHPVFKHFSEMNENVAFIPGDDIVRRTSRLPPISRGYGRSGSQSR